MVDLHFSTDIGSNAYVLLTSDSTILDPTKSGSYALVIGADFNTQVKVIKGGAEETFDHHDDFMLSTLQIQSFWLQVSKSTMTFLCRMQFIIIKQF